MFLDDFHLQGKNVELKNYELIHAEDEENIEVFKLTDAETKAYSDALDSGDLELEEDLSEEFCIARGRDPAYVSSINHMKYLDRFETFLHEAKLEAATLQSD